MRIPGSGLRIDDPAWPLLQAEIAYWGITTAAGLATGLTIVCADLANEPSYVGQQIKLLSGAAAGQCRTILISAAGTVTVDDAFRDNTGVVITVAAGTRFVIGGLSGGGGGPIPPTGPSQGLSFMGDVTTYTNPTTFASADLAGFGAFAFLGTYLIYVFRDGAGVAPQGEFRVVTGYAPATGQFTHEAFSANLAVGDKVLLVHISVLFPQIVARGTFTASSATVPADAGRGEADNWFNGCVLMPLLGNDAFQPKQIVDFANAGGVFTIDPSNPFTAVTGNVWYVILKDSMATPSTATGLCYKGTVTNWVNATQFAASGLAGFGNQAFANGQYFIFVFRDVAGAAAMPQGEFRLLQTYVSATGMFTHEAFSVDLTNGDEILIIHQSQLFPGAVSGYGVFDTSSTTVPADSTRAARYPWEVADQFKGMLLMPVMGDCRFIARRIVSFTLAGGIFTLDPNNPFPALPGNAEYLILQDQTEFVPGVNATINRTPSDVIGGKADTASDDPDVNDLSLMRLLKSLMRVWKCVIPNIDVPLAAIDSVLTTNPSAGAPDAENTIMDLAITAGTMYKLEDIIIKVSGYGTGTQITIQVWELLGGNARANYQNTHTVIVPTDYPLTTYLTLVDITGKPCLVGDGIAITAITDAGNTGALTCTYTYSTARVS